MIDQDEELKQLAIMLHNHLCNANHTDQCSWGYEGSDWNKPTHKRWLAKARFVAEIEKPKKAMKIIRKFSKIRNAAWKVGW